MARRQPMAGLRSRMNRKRFLGGLAAGAGAARPGPALATAGSRTPTATTDSPASRESSRTVQRRSREGPMHIDIHNHTIPRAYVEAARRDSQRLGTRVED